MGNQSSSLIKSDAYMTLSTTPGDLSSPLSIDTLIARHQKHLPVVVSTYRVAKHKSCNVSFREGHALCIHFHKESDAVTVVTTEGAKYVVPLRSSFLCSPRYVQRDVSGHYEGTVSDLWRQDKRLPRMIFITQGYLSPSGEEYSSVEEGQVLALNGIVNCNGKNALKCIDISTYEEKYLEKDCSASFTTDPSQLKTTLENYMNHMALPVLTIFFPSVEAQSHGFPESLTCTITGRHQIESVIASPYSLPLSMESSEVVEILLSSPIHVCTMRLPREQDEQLKAKTRQLLMTFSPTLISEVITNIDTPIDTKIQTVLFQCIEQDIYWSREFRSKDMPLLKDNDKTNRFSPHVINQPAHTNEHTTAADEEEEEEGIYDIIDSTIPLPLSSLPLPNDIQNLKENLKRHYSSDDTHTTPPVQQRQFSNDLNYSVPHKTYTPTVLHKSYSPTVPHRNTPPSTTGSPSLVHPKPPISNKPTKLRGGGFSPATQRHINESPLLQRNHSFNEQSSLLKEPSQSQHSNNQQPLETSSPYYDDNKLDEKPAANNNESQHEKSTESTTPQQIDSNRISRSIPDEDTKAKNIQKLKEYSVEEVLGLLDQLNLSQYKERFAEEQITGSLLLELDEDILANELDMKGRLHRLKIIRVIEGRQTL